jgi:hypothetical protein
MFRTLRKHATNLLHGAIKNMLHYIIQIYKWNENNWSDPPENGSREELEGVLANSWMGVVRTAYLLARTSACIWITPCQQEGLLHVLCTGSVPVNVSWKPLTHDGERHRSPKVGCKKWTSKADADERNKSLDWCSYWLRREEEGLEIKVLIAQRDWETGFIDHILANPN